MAITSLEMYTSIIWDKNPNAIVMLRDDAFLSSVSKGGYGPRRRRKDCRYLHAWAERSGQEKPEKKKDADKASQSVKMFRQGIVSSLPANQVHAYTCDVDGLHPTDKRRLNLVGLETFGETVLHFLQDRIDAQYPETTDEHLTVYDVLRGRHEEFMEQRSSNVVGREEEKKDIEDYIGHSYGNMALLSLTYRTFTTVPVATVPTWISELLCIAAYCRSNALMISIRTVTADEC